MNIPSYSVHYPDTIRCRYCDKYHQCDEDGVIEGMCDAERIAKRGTRRFIVPRRGPAKESISSAIKRKA